jgi:quinol monooxygenase YgiN
MGRRPAADRRRMSAAAAALTIVVKGRVKAGARDELFALHQRLAAPRAMENEAMPLVMWIADNKDDDVFYLIELYADASRLEGDMHAPWLADYLAKTNEVMDGEPEVSFGALRWAKGVSLA